MSPATTAEFALTPHEGRPDHLTDTVEQDFHLALSRRWSWEPNRGRHWSHQGPLLFQTLGRNRLDLAVEAAVDLQTPDPGLPVGHLRLPTEAVFKHQVDLDIAGGVLDDPLRFGVRALREVGSEANSAA